ncbi:TPR domain-containing protein [Sodiomyces alkalinus F11]|uniref:TPR domain-containing protein n=1 Tax=Sodiomyces alkalinus (strain CBS 110278 / VKM F-3762 / F11) TaxID=1314773 RepID=A0A3N2PNS2_SODAK|nr:TPR domain-containing protein [Sodiomyces alkalinus F11]ROT36165.1 TPR domain-containing protein [Sodiomyces alkalinus F11]
MAVPDPATQANEVVPANGREEESADEEFAEQTELEKTKADFDLQIGVEEILVDVDPNLSLDYLQKANRLAGKPPPHRTPRDKLVALHNQHVARKLQAGAQKAPRMVKKVILALSYPPSSRSIKELEKMPLSDLIVENHHEDAYIVVRTITPPYQGAGTVAIVEDEFGNTEKLALYNQGDSSVLNAVPEGSVVLVKEPYYKFSGDHDFMVCVDHPSDAILLRQGPGDEFIPESFRTGEPLTSAADWRDAGDQAFMARDLPQAGANYTRALELAPEDDTKFKSGLYTKRAGVNLTLKCFDNALQDALASLGGPTDWKSYFIAARAAYELTDFKTSKTYFEEALKRKPPSANVQKEYERCLARVEESEKGNYNLAEISRSVTTKNIHLDKASFICNTEVRSSPHHGRGLFAVRDIKAGEIIYAEKATCVPNEFNTEHNSAAAYAQLVAMCNDNPSIHRKVIDLYGGTYKRRGNEGTEIDGKPVVDVFLLESIRRKNCFSGTHVSAAAALVNSSNRSNVWKHGMSRGLWVYAAYSNHACVPNSNRSFVGDLLVSVASVDIPAGTEITHIYLPPKAAYLRRDEQYRASWGFACDCALCAGEAKSPRAAHERRIDQLAETEVFMGKKGMSPRKHQPDATIRQMERMAAKLDALHEPEVYEQLPKLMMVWPSMWLVEAWVTRKKWTKAVKWSLEVLRAFGFLEPLRRDEKGDPVLWIFRDTSAVITFETIKGLKVLAEAYKALGEDDLSAQAESAAKKGLQIMVGFVTEETYKAFD